MQRPVPKGLLRRQHLRDVNLLWEMSRWPIRQQDWSGIVSVLWFVHCGQLRAAWFC